MLNKQKGNMYGFVTHTWNTVKGKCSHDCSYCYMKKWGNNKLPRFDEKELKINLGENNFIFVGSSCDLFADDIDVVWIQKTLEHCRKYNKNKYMFQTKNPARLKRYNMPDNTILCVTIESNFNLDTNNAPLINDRVREFAQLNYDKKMITIEPIMEFEVSYLCDIINDIDPIQVNIGADSGNNNLKEPKKEKIESFIKCLKDGGVNYFLKDNLKRLMELKSE